MRNFRPKQPADRRLGDPVHHGNAAQRPRNNTLPNQSAPPTTISDEEKARRAAMLAQYGSRDGYEANPIDPSSYAPVNRVYGNRGNKCKRRHRLTRAVQDVPYSARPANYSDEWYSANRSRPADSLELRRRMANYESFEDAGLRNYRRGRKLATFVRILSVLIFLGSAVVGYLLFHYHVLPFTYRLAAAAILLIVNLIMFSIAKNTNHSVMSRFFGTVLGVPILAGVIVGCYFLLTIIGFLSGINTYGKAQISEIQVLVLKDSDIQSLEELQDLAVAAPLSADGPALNATLAKIKEDKAIELKIIETASYAEAANKLYDGEVSAILMNLSHVKNIENADHPNFRDETRSVYDYLFMQQRKQTLKRVNTDRDSFVMYISGIDTYGSIDSISRSDVNLLVSVNPQNHQILLTNIPRDTYLPIADGGQNQKDKLTHAGLYGVNSSVHTLENFLGVDINYYSRVNFTSLIKVVDALGGITLDNPVEFTAYNGMYFPTGEITLNGEEALAFSRERNSLADGDNDRGKNQQRVLAAIIRKTVSPSVVTNFNTVLSTFSENCETDMPVADIMKLVNKQIEDDTQWDIYSNILTGEGSVGQYPSYAMPGYELYMMIADENSKNSVISEINTTLQR